MATGSPAHACWPASAWRRFGLWDPPPPCRVRSSSALVPCTNSTSRFTRCRRPRSRGRAVRTCRRRIRDTSIFLRAALSTPFGISFEEAAERLGQLPRSCVEPDGSFFYASAQGQPPWQVDGNLFDRNGRLLFVDLKGNCPPEEFDRLLSALGWPGTAMAFQLVREAVLLDEAEFRRWAAIGLRLET